MSNPKARRIEVRFPDSSANPVPDRLRGHDDGRASTASRTRSIPGDPADKDLYDLEPEEAKHIPTVCHSLDMALEHLDKDREFLKRGGVFTDDVIDAYIGLKLQEVTRLRHVHASGGNGALLQLSDRCQPSQSSSGRDPVNAARPCTVRCSRHDAQKGAGNGVHTMPLPDFCPAAARHGAYARSP